MIWAKLCISHSKPIYICSFYRPPNKLTEPVTNLRSKISAHNPYIIIAGYFNFPSIKWEDGIGCIQSSPTYGSEVNYPFTEVINDSGLEQLVTQTTRSNHLLDLVFTMHPDLISDVNFVPGISDHEAVTFKIKLSFSIYIPSAKHLRKVYHYHSANTNRIRKWTIFQICFFSRSLSMLC